MNLADLGPLRAPLRHTHCVFIAALNTHVECLETALEKPAGERIRGLSPDDHLSSYLFNVRRRYSDRATKNVAVAVEVFGGRMNYDVGPVRERAKIDRTRECRVYYHRNSALFCQNRDLWNIEDASGGVHRGFHEDHARVLPNSVSPDAALVRVCEAHFDSHRRKLFRKELSRS